MKLGIASYIYSFDFTKALLLTSFLTVVLYVGIQQDAYEPAFLVVLGALYAYFPAIEGIQRHRILGMVAGFGLAVVASIICLVSMFYLPLWAYVLVASVLIFLISLLAVYGFRGAMVAFSGLFAVVVSFTFDDIVVPPSQIIAYFIIGGVCYIILAIIVHSLLQKRHIEVTLADAIVKTVEFMERQEIILQGTASDKQKANEELLHKQQELTEKHELLRQLLMSETAQRRNSIHHRRFYVIFLELITFYESILAKTIAFNEMEQSVEATFFKELPLSSITNTLAEQLKTIAAAMRQGKSVLTVEQDNESLASFKTAIEQHISTLELPADREKVLILRNMYEYEHAQWERVVQLGNLYNWVKAGDSVVEVSEEAKLFVTTEEYTWDLLKENFSFKSTIFRHSLRLVIAVFVGFVLGNLLHNNYTNWIVVTIVVILRPHYGLTKHRLTDRLLGTILGAALVALLLWLTPSTYIYSVVAAASMLIGYTFMQKKYWIAAAGITIAVLLLYAIMEDNPLEKMQWRLQDSSIGALISFLAIYLIWPSWEATNIKDAILEALDANLIYFGAIVTAYQSKETDTLTFRLVRKEAFVLTSNLSAAYQRMIAEPTSKQANPTLYYTVVTLIQLLLSASASFSNFVQERPTTPMSPAFRQVTQYITSLLNNAVEHLRAVPLTPSVSKTSLKEAQKEIHLYYQQLNDERNKELAKGIHISPQMHAQLIEGKVMLLHLDWLVNIAEQLRLSASELKSA